MSGSTQKRLVGSIYSIYDGLKVLFVRAVEVIKGPGSQEGTSMYVESVVRMSL